MTSFEFKTSFGDSYTLTFELNRILIDAYLIGSMTGGTGTEKKSVIKDKNLSNFLEIYSVASPQDLPKLLSSFDVSQKEKFLESILEFEEVTFIWSETDFSD
jgi:hypothetical protein